jgi:putative sterol carrier protein
MKDLEVGLELLKIVKAIKKPIVVIVDGEAWSIDLNENKISPGAPEKFEFSVEMSEEVLKDMISGKVDPIQAVVGAKIKIKGSMAHAMKLQALRPKLLKLRSKY